MRILVFANHKGGVGKTASVSAISAVLGQKGFKVLMVDLDSQANQRSLKEPSMMQL